MNFPTPTPKSTRVLRLGELPDNVSWYADSTIDEFRSMCITALRYGNKQVHNLKNAPLDAVIQHGIRNPEATFKMRTFDEAGTRYTRVFQNPVSEPSSTPGPPNVSQGNYD